MSYLVLFVLLGIAFITMLLVWSFRDDDSSSTHAVSDGNCPFADMDQPSDSLVHRLFDQADWDYVSKQARPEAARVFLRERTDLAVGWLRQTRQQSARLMRLHRRAVRLKVDLKADLEIRLMGNYLSLLILCTFLHVVIRTRGPFRVPFTSRYARYLADRMRLVSKQAFAPTTSH